MVGRWVRWADVMVDRRLVGLVPESRRYIALNVGFQWIALVANICLIVAVCRLLGRIFGQTAAAGDLVATAAVALVAVAVRALARERAGRTVLLVSHRASTMRIADTVVSVEDGRAS